MSSMPAAGFSEMPPVSKVTPLPTMAIGAPPLAPAPFHCITTTWLGRSLPCPTASSAPMPSRFKAASLRTSTCTPALLSALTLVANSAGPSTLAGSLTRSRARFTPSAMARSGANACPAARGSATCTTSFFRRLAVVSLAVVGVVAVVALLGRLGFVFVEFVIAQLRAEREARRVFRSYVTLHGLEIDMRGGPFPSAELAPHGAAEIEPILVGELARLAETNHNDARELHALWREHVDARALLALERGDLRRLGQKPLGPSWSRSWAAGVNLPPSSANTTATPSPAVEGLEKDRTV